MRVLARVHWLHLGAQEWYGLQADWEQAGRGNPIDAFRLIRATGSTMKVAKRSAGSNQGSMGAIHEVIIVGE